MARKEGEKGTRSTGIPATRGPVKPEKRKTRKLSVDLDADDHLRLVIHAHQNGLTLSEQVIMMVRELKDWKVQANGPRLKVDSIPDDLDDRRDVAGPETDSEQSQAA